MKVLIDEFSSEYAGRRVLVTGGGGFIGTHLCQALAHLKADVYAVSRSKPAAAGRLEQKILHADLIDLNRVMALFDESRPQIVFHLAGQVTTNRDIVLVHPMLQNNLVGAVNLFLAAQRSACQRVVAVGTAEEPLGGVPLSPYAAAKAAASLYAKMFNDIYGLSTVLIRPSLTYGPCQSSTKLVSYAVQLLLKNESPIINSPARICDFIYVKDVVRGMLKAGLRSGVDGTAITLGTGVGTPVADLMNLLRRLTGATVEPDYNNARTLPAEAPCVADDALGWERLGWRPEWSLLTGLTETVAWYKNGGSHSSEGPS